jgi:hypothetical protein
MSILPDPLNQIIISKLKSLVTNTTTEATQNELISCPATSSGVVGLGLTLTAGKAYMVKGLVLGSETQNITTIKIEDVNGIVYLHEGLTQKYFTMNEFVVEESITVTITTASNSNIVGHVALYDIGTA